MKVRNTFIIFIVSGFWHGANWTFIVWGALNAIYFLPLLLTNKNRQNLEVVAGDSYLPSIKELGQMALTFGLTVIAWVFFRAENIGHAVSYLGNMFSKSFLSIPYYEGLGSARLIISLLLIFIVIEWLGRRNQFALEKLFINQSIFIRLAAYYTIAFIIFYTAGEEQQFIYFQF